MRTLVVLLSLLSPSAYADKATARARFATATQHYDLGEFREALSDFKEAYRNFEDPTFLFNIAQCHRQLGEKEQAIRFFHTYLNKRPDARNRDDVQDMMGKLEDALQQERLVTRSPPQGTMSAETISPTPAPEVSKPIVLAPSTTAPAATPVYRKWWLWTVVGVVAAGVGVGLGVGLTRTPTIPSASTQDGTFHPF